MTHSRAAGGLRRRWDVGAEERIKGLSPAMSDYAITAGLCTARPVIERIRHLIPSAGAMDDVQYASAYPLITAVEALFVAV